MYEKKLEENNEEIIYFVSNTVVLLNIKLTKQRFYTLHENEVISMAISNLNGDYVATGELAPHLPCIHIWNCRSLENVSILRGIHKHGVHLLAFSGDDRFLFTCGHQVPSPVVVYDWQTGAVIISASI